MAPRTCTHVDQIAAGVTASGSDCQSCPPDAVRFERRMCLVCGHVGCCDSSPGRHATAHFQATGHAVMRSIEPGANWGWCYVDEKMLDDPGKSPTGDDPRK